MLIRSIRKWENVKVYADAPSVHAGSCRFMWVHASSCRFLVSSRRFLQVHACFCNFMQVFKSSCKLIQVCAGSCRFLQVHACWCEFMQFDASTCRFMQVNAGSNPTSTCCEFNWALEIKGNQDIVEINCCSEVYESGKMVNHMLMHLLTH